MKVVVVGLGIQGRKRLKVAGADAIATVDPVVTGADYRRIQDVPDHAYEAALLCVPDREKLDLIEYLVSRGKHVLVEKPLLSGNPEAIEHLKHLIASKGVACYTAYNHRFEPHIVRLKALLDSGELGSLYLARFSYGNGTARDVRDSSWRDQGLGVLPDLGSHLLDWSAFLFGRPDSEIKIWSSHRFENRAFDHVRFGFEGQPALDFEVTLLSWRNSFRADVIGERGSAHIDSLCKWGPTTFTLRKRVLPSGRPDEEATTLVAADPTWEREWEHFKSLCRRPQTNIDTDIWINSVLIDAAAKVGVAM
jgi:scyllo-inositol 2-dehydrogenase (NADP+)